MKTIGILPKQQWAEKDEVKKLFEIFTQNNIDAKFVGGCVRDAILKIEPNDIDIAVASPIENVKLVLETNKVIVHPVGIDHGSLIAVIKDTFFQITTLRRDDETDGRYAKISTTSSWDEDAKRRDFTMNALYLDIDGKLYDPTGLGLKDLKEGRIRFIGNPENRIKEDYLRILRFFRFFAHYGKIDPIPEVINIIEKNVDKLEIISKERKTYELLKLLESNKKSMLRSIEMLNNAGVWNNIFGFNIKEDNIELLKNIRKYEKDTNLQTSKILRLFTLCGGEEIDLPTIHKELSLSKDERKTIDHLSFIIRNNLHKALKLSDIKKSLYFWDRQHVIDIFIYYVAYNNTENLDVFVETIDEWIPPLFPISGSDLMEIGYKSGPLIGSTLKELEKTWIESDFEIDEEELIDMARSKLPGLKLM